METYSNVLDYNEESTVGQDPEDHLADTGQRFVNYLIDQITVYAIIFLGGIVQAAFTEDTEPDTAMVLITTLVPLLAIPTYFILMEYYLGKTLGKLITNTQVVTKYGEHPSLLNIVGRTFCRLIPFDAFSFLFSVKGWHDSISETRVVRHSFFQEPV